MILNIKKIVVLQFALIALLAVSASAEPIRVLFISGRNNHRWKLTTPFLKKTMEDSGRFKVDVTEKPAEITAKMLEGYDVIFNGWTGFPKTTGHLWGLDTEKAIDDFVAGGKGMASFHAGSSSFHDWEGFQKIIGAVWGKGTGHGRYHEFTVDMTDVDHPITKGMKSFKTSDELWHRVAVLQPTPGRKVLCTAMSAKANRGTGKDEPIAICTTFGKGRGFYTSLGHDVKALANPGCKLLMLRGIEWAATGTVTIGSGETAAPAASGDGKRPTALNATMTYKYPGDRAVLNEARDYIQKTAAKSDESRQAVASELGLMLKSKDATIDCKKFVCDQLSLVGSARQIPTLAALLANEDMATEAKSALLRISGDDALAAMRKMLTGDNATIIAGLIATLGDRGDAGSIDAISKHLGAKGAAGEAAVDALGNIGGAKSLAILMQMDSKAPKELQPALNDALLKCADGLADAGESQTAGKAYTLLSAPGRPRHVRVAAFPGMIAAQKGKGAPLLLAALTGEDRTMRSAAVRCLTRFKGKDITQAVADKLGSLQPTSQVQVIGILAQRQDPAALAAISALASSKDDEVRQAALSGMGQLGDTATVKPLVAAMSNEADRPTVRQSLARLKGDGVDKELTANLASADPAIRIEIIAVLNTRNASSAADALLKLASSDAEDDVRKEAIKALGAVSDGKMCPKLVDLMPKARKSSELRGIVNALILITRNSSDAAAGEITTMLGEKFTATKDAKTKSAILIVAGGVGGSQSLKIARIAAKDSDTDVRTAAVRAMSAWADAEPIGDLLALARIEKEIVPKTLALRGIVTLSSRAKDAPPEKLLAVYTEAMKLAGSAADTKTLLSGLGAIGSPKALELAVSYLDNKETVNEAAMAVVNIAEKIAASDPDAAKTALGKATAACKLKIVANRVTKLMVLLNKPMNLARGAKTSSPDGLADDGQSSGHQAAIDGDPNTYWDKANNAKLYRLKIEFKRPTEVSALSIQGYAHHDYAPKDFEILCDDKSVKTVKGAVYSDNVLVVQFPKTTCKSLELKITGYYGASPAIRELEIYNPKQTAEAKASSTSSATAPQAAKGFAWKETDNSVALMNGDKIVWRLNHDPKVDKPYIHPLATTDGSVLTWHRPADHIWHRALWFSWKAINGLNYWEEDRKTFLSRGRTSIKNVKVTLNKDFSAKAEIVLSYHPPAKPEVLSEKRTILFGAPTKDGLYRIDWSAVFTAVGSDAVLSRTPIKGEKGGKGWGGYAGLSIRMAKETRGWSITDSKGRKDMKIHGQPDAVWVDASGKTTTGKNAGVAILDHPKNSRHPSPWYIAKGMPYFSPAILYNEPLTLKKDQTLKLKYRIIVHPGLGNAKMLDEEFKTFTKN